MSDKKEFCVWSYLAQTNEYINKCSGDFRLLKMYGTYKYCPYCGKQMELK